MPSEWLNNLRTHLLLFLEQQRDETIPGYFRYAFSGDVFQNKNRSNLAGSIFALKLYHMLNMHQAAPTHSAIERILSFQKSDGTIYDPFIYRKSFIRNLLSNLSKAKTHNLNNDEYIRAETRQAYSALLLYDIIPDHLYANIPTQPDAVKKYIDTLDWKRPWGAGSHVSHLLFFLSLLRKAKRLDETTYNDAREMTLSSLSSLQHNSDGTWYTGLPSPRQKVNGAMKVITGLLIDNVPFTYPDRLIDLCLHTDTQQTSDACDQINQVLVLRYADEQCQHSHRRDEIFTFCEKILWQWQDYYHQNEGGFSFHKNRANDRYYGANVSRGLNEPDIHGTVLFVWGLSLMAKLIPLPELDWLQEMKS